MRGMRIRSSRKSVEKYDRNMRVGQARRPSLNWLDPSAAPFQRVGFPWFKRDRVYRRMPKRPAWPLPEAVDVLANHTAGGQIRFRTNSRRLVLRTRLTAPPLMDHMAVTGQGGFDCYLGTVGRQRYLGSARFKVGARVYESILFELPEATMRQVTINFPLYAGVKKVLIGLDQGARVRPPPPCEDDRAIIAYGTSITQGGCACRPGMAWTNILSRRINRPFVNVGFSGSGKGEPEVARAIAGIRDPSLYVLDYEANCPSADHLAKTLPEFIRILRKTHRRVPILVVSKIRFASENFDPVRAKEHRVRHDIQKAVVRRLNRAGDRRVFFLDGGRLLGRDFDECTVDGVHPTDLGFMRIADGLTPVIRRILRWRGGDASPRRP